MWLSNASHHRHLNLEPSAGFSVIVSLSVQHSTAAWPSHVPHPTCDWESASSHHSPHQQSTSLWRCLLRTLTSDYCCLHSTAPCSWRWGRAELHLVVASGLVLLQVAAVPGRHVPEASGGAESWVEAAGLGRGRPEQLFCVGSSANTPAGSAALIIHGWEHLCMNVPHINTLICSHFTVLHQVHLVSTVSWRVCIYFRVIITFHWHLFLIHESK